MHEGGGLTGSATQELRSQLDEFLEACQSLIRYSPEPLIKEESYISLCDLLIVFSEQIASTSSFLSDLITSPDRNLQLLLNEFVQNFVFVPEQIADHDEHRIEELHKRRNFLAAYSKLIVYNIMPTKAAADVFQHYVKFYNEYGDIIKATLSKAREINKVNCALTMCLSMNMMYQEIQKTVSKGNRQNEEFFALKVIYSFLYSFSFNRLY